jgi:uncharacterized protein YcfJ
MNNSMSTVMIFGVGIAVALAGVAGYRSMSGPDYARVVSVIPVIETVKNPREECRDEVVTRQKPVKDKHQITGTVIGAVAGGVLGNALGGGGKNTGAKIAGAAVGGYAGNKTHEKIQTNNTYESTERVCNTVIDSAERTVGYDVKYLIGDTLGTVRMDHDPGDTIPLKDGKINLSRGPALSGS